MELTNATIPACEWKTGQDIIEVLPPANLRIATTGTAGVVILNGGPQHGKKWTVNIRVEVTETDV